MISVSLALPFLVDESESDGLLGALKLSHIDSVFLSPSQPFLMAPGPEFPPALLFTLLVQLLSSSLVTFHCLSKFSAMVLSLLGSP